MNETEPPFSIIKNTISGKGCRVIGWANIYNSKFGDDVVIGPFVEIGGAVIGDRTVISSHTYICPNVEIGPDCFIAHNVSFTNDLFESPRYYKHISELKTHWKPRTTTVGKCVRIGSGAVILPVVIGDHCIIGAGAVITKDVPANTTVIGVPGRFSENRK